MRSTARLLLLLSLAAPVSGCIQHNPYAPRRASTGSQAATFQPTTAAQTAPQRLSSTAARDRGGEAASTVAATRALTQPTPAELPPAIVRSELRERAIGLLEDMTQDVSAQVRANAIEGLEQTPARLASAVGPATQDANAGVRSVAALAIGRNNLCDQVPLVRSMTRDESPYARIASAFALAKCGDTSAINVLADLLFTSPEIRVRSLSAYALGELGEPSAAAMLRQAADIDVPRATDIEMRVFGLQIAESLFKLGENDALDTIHTALFPSRPEDLEATALAAQIIGEVRSRRSLPDLQNLIAYQDEMGNTMPAEVRLAAASARAKLGRPDAADIALEYVENPSLAIRAQAALTLGEIGRDEDLPTLARMLDDPNPLVQVAAATGILNTVSGRGGFSDRSR